MTPAQRWSAVFKGALKRRRMSQHRLQVMLGAGHGTVQGWYKGERLPSLERGLAAAEILDWDYLRELIIELRTRTCERCGATFIVKKAADAKWCSPRCRQYRLWPKSNARRSEARRQRVGRLLSVYQETVERLCRVHCPVAGPQSRAEGVCPDATCPVQEMGLSPLPVGTGLLERVA